MTYIEKVIDAEIQNLQYETNKEILKRRYIECKRRIDMYVPSNDDLRVKLEDAYCDQLKRLR